MVEEGRAAFRLQFEDCTKLLVVDMRGFWDRALFERYRTDLIRMVERQECERIGFLCHGQDFPVQAADVAQGFATLPTEPALAPIVASAFLVSTMMNKMQIDRIFDGQRQRAFHTEAEARQWLSDKMAEPA